MLAKKISANIKTKNQVTIPKEIVKILDLHVSDKLEVEINDNGQIVMTPVEILPKKVVEDLKEAFDDLKNGRISEIMTAEELIEKLGL